MNTVSQRQAIDLLTELTALSEDVRLGQLLAHLGVLGEDQFERTLWDLEDDELLAVMRRHRDELLARDRVPMNGASKTEAGIVSKFVSG